LERFFEEELAAKYNQHFHSKWIPELKRKYDPKVRGEWQPG